MCRGRLLFPRDPAAAWGCQCNPCRWRSLLCRKPLSEVGQGAFGVQLRNGGRSKPKGNFLGRSQKQNSMKSRQLIRIHPSGYFRSEGLKERKVHNSLFTDSGYLIFCDLNLGLRGRGGEKVTLRLYCSRARIKKGWIAGWLLYEICSRQRRKWKAIKVKLPRAAAEPKVRAIEVQGGK